MRKYNYLFLSLLLATSLFASDKTNYKHLSPEELAEQMTPLEHYDTIIKAMEHKNWHTAQKHLHILKLYFPDSPHSEDVLYYEAVCSYHLLDYDLSNKKLDLYLEKKGRLKYFEDAISYKLAIANKFKLGARKHLFNLEKFPKWLPARENALQIFDEVIRALPNHDLAAQAFYSKGMLLKEIKEYEESIECFTLFLKRFPKHHLGPDSYLAIGQIYYDQSHTEFNNPDILELSQLNLRRFLQKFPRDKRVEKGKETHKKLQELHAKGLYETGLFYERIKKPKASVIYYVTALEKFPNSKSAAQCKKRLSRLHEAVAELEVSEDFVK